MEPKTLTQLTRTLLERYRVRVYSARGPHRLTLELFPNGWYDSHDPRGLLPILRIEVRYGWGRRVLCRVSKVWLDPWGRDRAVEWSVSEIFRGSWEMWPWVWGRCSGTLERLGLSRFRRLEAAVA